MEKILFKEIITGWLGWWTPSATKGNQANGFAGVRTDLDIYVPCLMKKTKNNKKKTHSISHCCTKTVILNIFKRSVFLKPACFSTLTKKSCASFTNSLIICVCIITEGTTTNCSQTPEHLSGVGLKAPPDNWPSLQWHSPTFCVCLEVPQAPEPWAQEARQTGSCCSLFFTPNHSAHLFCAIWSELH